MEPSDEAEPRTSTPVPPRSSADAAEGQYSSPQERPLTGKAIIITGAGSGIGRATAGESARRGAQLVLIGRRRQLLEDAAEECRRLGSAVVILAADVSEPETASKAIEVTNARFGRVDGLVNNAGLARFAPLEDAREDDIRAMFEVNFLAPLRFIREATKPLRATRGSVVNVTSIGGVVATPRRAAYGALKAATNHLTRSLARELAPDVRVNAVVPGPVDTPMYDDLGMSAVEAHELAANMLRTTPAGRLAEPREVARWICELLDDRSSWVTGSLITVDGGRSS